MIEALALARIRRRYAGKDSGRLRAFLAARTEAERSYMGASEIVERLIQAIRKAEARGMTRGQLAERSGVPRSTLTRLVNRERESLKVETVEKLSKELGLKLELRPRVTRRRIRKAAAAKSTEAEK